MLFFERLSRREKIALSTGIAFLLAASMDRLAIGPITARMQYLNQEIKIAEKKLSQHLRNLNQKETIETQYQDYVDYVKKVGSDEEEVARILGELESLARKAVLYLADVKPQTPKEVGFHKEYAVEVEAEGEMESVIKFLHYLNNSPQLLRAERMRLRLKDKKSTLIKATLLVVKVVIP